MGNTLICFVFVVFFEFIDTRTIQIVKKQQFVVLGGTLKLFLGE